MSLAISQAGGFALGMGAGSLALNMVEKCGFVFEDKSAAIACDAIVGVAFLHFGQKFLQTNSCNDSKPWLITVFLSSTAYWIAAKGLANKCQIIPEDFSCSVLICSFSIIAIAAVVTSVYTSNKFLQCFDSFTRDPDWQCEKGITFSRDPDEQYRWGMKYKKMFDECDPGSKEKLRLLSSSKRPWWFCELGTPEYWGCKRTQERASLFLSKAALQGHREAQFDYGLWVIETQGLTEYGQKEIEKAALQGHRAAMQWLLDNDKEDKG